MYIVVVRHPVGRGLKAIIIRYVGEKITIAYRKLHVWSKDTESNVPITASDKRHNDSLEKWYKQSLDVQV